MIGWQARQPEGLVGLSKMMYAQILSHMKNGQSSSMQCYDSTQTQIHTTLVY